MFQKLISRGHELGTQEYPNRLFDLSNFICLSGQFMQKEKSREGKQKIYCESEKGSKWLPFLQSNVA